MKRLLAAVVLSLSTMFVAAGLVAVAPAAPAHAASGIPAHWEYNYHVHWFATLAKCRKWGNGAVHGNEVQRKIPYVDNFKCHKLYGDTAKSKWSIDLHYKDMPCHGGAAGCGGGGGGSGSWAVQIGAKL